MQLLPQQQKNIDVLRNLASEGVGLLSTSQFELLVARYGYALSHGRNAVEAVQMDLSQALSEASGHKLLHVRPEDLSIVFYQDNAACLRAAIDCEIPTQAGRNIWVSFVVTGTETDQSLTLEDICA